MTRNGVNLAEKTKFIVDHNVGKLTKLLRLMGFDAVFFAGLDDADMVATALAENRVVLTRDTQIMKRGIIASGQVRAMLIEGDRAELQVRQVIAGLGLRLQIEPFSLCLECNQPLEPKDREGMKHRVPPYVYQTQQHYMECPNCHRVYWRGTHWQAMAQRLDRIVKSEEQVDGAEKIQQGDR